jgi:hypothetical protein
MPAVTRRFHNRGNVIVTDTGGPIMTTFVAGLAVLAVILLAGYVVQRLSREAPTMPDYCTDEDIRRLALSGQRVVALKWYRQLHRVDVREAIAAVDAMTRRAA